MNKRRSDFGLTRKRGRVILRFHDCACEVPVKVVWARPLTGRGREVSFVDDDKKEIAMADDLSVLDEGSRVIAEEEIGSRYLLPRISSVMATRTHFGTRFWKVETDRGSREFAVRDPNRSVLHLGDDHIVIRDTLGNCYEIESLARLDKRSQELVERMV